MPVNRKSLFIIQSPQDTLIECNKYFLVNLFRDEWRINRSSKTVLFGFQNLRCIKVYNHLINTLASDSKNVPTLKYSSPSFLWLRKALMSNPFSIKSSTNSRFPCSNAAIIVSSKASSCWKRRKVVRVLKLHTKMFRWNNCFNNSPTMLKGLFINCLCVYYSFIYFLLFSYNFMQIAR